MLVDLLGALFIVAVSLTIYFMRKRLTFRAVLTNSETALSPRLREILMSPEAVRIQVFLTALFSLSFAAVGLWLVIVALA